MDTTTTYREAIQKLQSDLEKNYNEAGYLRDFASSEESEYFNNARVAISTGITKLSKLDNSLSSTKASLIIHHS